MYKRIDHVALHVADLERSVSFYERNFGFKDYYRQAVPDGPRIAYLKLGETSASRSPQRAAARSRQPPMVSPSSGASAGPEP